MVSATPSPLLFPPAQQRQNPLPPIPIPEFESHLQRDNFALSSLKSEYNLEAELFSAPQPHCSLIRALNFAIIEHANEFALLILKSIPPKELDKATAKLKLTPIHFAAISGNGVLVEALVKAGANINAADVKGWRPLHHAALAGNALMIRLLLARGADPALQTHSGSTFEHIVQLIQPPQKPDAPIPLFGVDATGKEFQFTQRAFQQLTSAHFLDENVIHPNLLCKYWRTPKAAVANNPLFSSLEKEFATFMQNPPPMVLKHVTHDADGKKLTTSPGLGLFAHSRLQERAFIGEYVGKQTDGNENSPYALEMCNAIFERNGLAHINDGFPNVFLIDFQNTIELPYRFFFVVGEPIGAGTELVWNYGNHTDKFFGPYVELRPNAVRKFMKSHTIEELISCLVKAFSEKREATFAEYVKAVKFRYILQTPAVLFLMTFENVIEVKDLYTMMQMGYALEIIFESSPVGKDGFDLIKTTYRAVEFRSKIKDSLPCFTKTFEDYFKALPSRAGIVCTLAILQITLERLKNVEAQLKGANDKQTKAQLDLACLMLWDKILPANEKYVEDDRQKLQQIKKANKAKAAAGKK